MKLLGLWLLMWAIIFAPVIVVVAVRAFRR